MRVATWAEFEAAEPQFAARVRKLLTTRKHLTMATLRRDGSPRISGTEIHFADGDLRMGSMANALKARDLQGDPRVAIHGPTHDPRKDGGWRGEAKIAGRAHEVSTGGEGHTFCVDIGEVVLTQLGSNGLLIESWHPGRGYRAFDRP